MTATTGYIRRINLDPHVVHLACWMGDTPVEYLLFLGNHSLVHEYPCVPIPFIEGNKIYSSRLRNMDA